MHRLCCLLTIFAVGMTPVRGVSFPEAVGVGPDENFPATYEETLSAIEQKRVDLLKQYDGAMNETERAAVLRKAGDQFLRSVAQEIAPFWYGTPWDFNGTTEIPGTGEIACGYFVTTVLRDIGVDLERVRLAQVPSEVMIRSLAGPGAIQRFSDVPIETFLGAVREWGLIHQ